MRLLVVLSTLLITLAAFGEDAAPAPISREVCAGCHEEAATFAAGPHGRAMAMRSAEILDGSCSQCHGPAEQHVESPAAGNIRRAPDATACEGCHQGASEQVRRMTPAHARHRVDCLDCHASGHNAINNGSLLARKPVELCGSCHAEQKSAANLPYAHRDGIDPMPCTNCHSLHGVKLTARLSLAEPSGACSSCHAEKSGPWVFPHPPRSVDGCATCHAPHGSPNPRMLNRRVISSLCLECHTNTPSFHDLSQARYQACTSCHTAVHGSNRSRALFDE